MKSFFQKHKTKLKIVSTVAAFSLAIAMALTSALAFFKYEEVDESVITTMNTDILLVQDGNTTSGLKYTVQPTEANTDYIYTRVIIFPIIEIESADGSGKWNAYAGIPTSNINYTVNGTHWHYYDGYYYYQYQIDSGVNSIRQKTTELVISNVTLDTTSFDDGSNEYFDLPTSIDGKDIRVRFYVSAEAVQAKNNAYQLNWDLTEDEFINSIKIKDLNKIDYTSTGIDKNPHN